MKSRHTRLLVAALLALSLAGLRPQLGFAATTVSDCPSTESGLSTDIASAGAGGTVSFTCSTATTIPFDSAHGGTGAITVSQDLTLDASHSAGAVTFDGGNATQLFIVNNGVTLTLDGLTLQHGLAPETGTGSARIAQGGAILSSGTVNITNSTFSGNADDSTPYNLGGLVQSPYDLGGAIFSTGTLSITNSTLSGNSASNGGAIDATGTLSITNSTFSGNSAIYGGAMVSTGTLSITGSSFSNNSGDTSTHGGAILNSGPANIANSTFSGNSGNSIPTNGAAIANEDQNSLTITGSTFSNNSGGAAIYNGTGASATISASTFSNNSGGSFGGAIDNQSGTVSITSSAFSGNAASASGGVGGAIFNFDTVNITDSTLSGNSAPNGGAINNTGTLTITDSTLSGNSATSYGGAVSNYGPLTFAVGVTIGGPGTLTITNSTIAGNTAPDGAALFNTLNATVNVGSSIIVDSGGGNCHNTNAATLNDNGYNLEWSGSGNTDTCGFAVAQHDLTGQDPMLSSLAENGGPTQTLALQSSSPAIDAIPTSSGLCQTKDQRGNARPDESGETSCDIGAYESAYLATTTSLSSSANPSVYGQAVTFTATVGGSGTGTPTGSVAFKDGATTLGTAALGAGGNPANVATFSTSALSVGPHAVTASYGGNATFQSSTSSALSQTVNQAATTTHLNSSANPSVINQPVTYAAKVSVKAPAAGSPTGTVAFSDNGSAISGCGSVSLDGSGTATCTVTYATTGSHPITATYSGDTNFLTSNDSLTQQVNAPTTTQVTSSANPSVFGQAVTFTATVSGPQGSGTPTGTVQFSIDGTKVGGPVTLDGTGKATYSTSSLAVTGGTNHTVTAAYSSDTTSFLKSSGSLTQEVDKAATGTTLSSSLNPSVSGQAVTFTATVSVTKPGAGSITGTVTFRDGTTTLGTGTVSTTAGVSTATLTTSSLTAGGHTITAVYGGSSTLASSTSAGLTQNVNTNLSSYPKLANGAYNLSNVNLSGAYLVGANLAGANISNANLSGANLSGANLKGANLTDANFSNTNLSGANLTNANLTDANFSNTNLTGANLSGANLTSANFTGANFTKANLSNAKLTQTNLKAATGMSTATLIGVIWSKTTCPDNTTSSQDGGTCIGHL